MTERQETNRWEEALRLLHPRFIARYKALKAEADLTPRERDELLAYADYALGLDALRVRLATDLARAKGTDFDSEFEALRALPEACGALKETE